MGRRGEGNCRVSGVRREEKGRRNMKEGEGWRKNGKEKKMEERGQCNSNKRRRTDQRKYWE